MRHLINLNADWSFLKGVNTPGVTEGAEQVNLPHSWNAVDGQDGGNDYFYPPTRMVPGVDSHKEIYT